MTSEERNEIKLPKEEKPVLRKHLSCELVSLPKGEQKAFDLIHIHNEGAKSKGLTVTFRGNALEREFLNISRITVTDFHTQLQYHRELPQNGLDKGKQIRVQFGEYSIPTGVSYEKGVHSVKAGLALFSAGFKISMECAGLKTGIGDLIVSYSPDENPQAGAEEEKLMVDVT